MLNLTGPFAKIKLLDSVGCQPFSAKFDVKISANEVGSLYPNDGNKLDINISGQINHTYLNVGKYKSYLQLTDSLNCTVSQEIEENIVVNEKPKAAILAEPYCAYKTVNILNNSSFVNSKIIGYQWIAPTIDTNKNLNTTLLPGLNSVLMIVENEAGCKDTLSTKIKAFGDSVMVALSKNILCQTYSVVLTANFRQDTSINYMQWEIDGQYFAGKTLKYKPMHNGKITGKFSYQNALGCSYESISFDLQAQDTIPKTSVLLDYLTVQNNNAIYFQHQKETANDFVKYRTLFSQPAKKYWETILNTNQNLTNYAKNPMPNNAVNPYCIWMDYANLCNTPMDTNLLYKHCGIGISALPDTLAVGLNWNPYLGRKILNYTIYRQQDGINWISLGIVDKDTTHFIDTDFICAVPSQYKIIAQLDSNFASESNFTLATPFNRKNAAVYEIENISVIDQKLHLFIEPLGANTTELNIYKSPSNQIVFNALKETFIDEISSIREKQFYYNINKNSCKILSDRSKNSNNIVLRLTKLNEKDFQLTWNAPYHWENNFEGYLLQQINVSNSYETIKTFTLADSSFIYQQVAAACVGNDVSLRIVGYRIKNTDTLFANSNAILIAPKSSLFMPNAFTPNSNGLNETFGPVGVYIKKYQMLIYNSWGEQIFETTTCMQGWDGTSQTENCQQGVYTYLVYAQGIDGKVYNYKGDFTLLR